MSFEGRAILKINKEKSFETKQDKTNVLHKSSISVWILVFLIITTFTVSVGSSYAVLKKCELDNPEVVKSKKLLSTGLILMSISSILGVLSLSIGGLKLPLGMMDNKIINYLIILTFSIGMIFMIYPMSIF